jgi:hypothetical protein
MPRTPLALALLLCTCPPLPAADPAAAARPPAPLIRSARSGPWSLPATWEGGRVPPAGARVQVRAGHTVTYDVGSGEAIRFLHVAGTGGRPGRVPIPGVIRGA